MCVNEHACWYLKFGLAQKQALHNTVSSSYHPHMHRMTVLLSIPYHLALMGFTNWCIHSVIMIFMSFVNQAGEHSVGQA